VIFEYISSDDADAAKRVIARILQAVAMIEDFRCSDASAGLRRRESYRSFVFPIMRSIAL
jgi:hypothetical protein